MVQFINQAESDNVDNVVAELVRHHKEMGTHYDPETIYTEVVQVYIPECRW